MSSRIDMQTIPHNIPSLCIPRVHTNISAKQIRKKMDELNIGVIEWVEIVRRNHHHDNKGKPFNKVFIHLKYWNNSDNALVARERLLNGKDIKIVYDEPWYWKAFAYKEQDNKSYNKYPKSNKSRENNKSKTFIKIDNSDDGDSVSSEYDDDNIYANLPFPEVQPYHEINYNVPVPLRKRKNIANKKTEKKR